MPTPQDQRKPCVSRDQDSPGLAFPITSCVPWAHHFTTLEFSSLPYKRSALKWLLSKAFPHLIAVCILSTATRLYLPSPCLASMSLPPIHSSYWGANSLFFQKIISCLLRPLGTEFLLPRTLRSSPTATSFPGSVPLSSVDQRNHLILRKDALATRPGQISLAEIFGFNVHLS